MQNQAWDKLAETIEKARTNQEGAAGFFWSIQTDKKYWVHVEWNGGLPIIGYQNCETGQENWDVTATQMCDLLEACE